MKYLTDQSVSKVVETDEAQPWEEPVIETAQPEIVEAEQVEETEKPNDPMPECIQMYVSLEGTSCIRLDSLGGGKIQLAFSDSQAKEAFQLGKYRGMILLATFLISSKSAGKKGKR